MDEVDVPSYFLCPISLQIMKDPVTVSSGITYDREPKMRVQVDLWKFSKGIYRTTQRWHSMHQPQLKVRIDGVHGKDYKHVEAATQEHGSHEEWCRKGNELMMVYDYMPNNSLNH
ncbi:hypothetical protein NE237_018975 [Protea cynaroides]|uniref:U-box domain-containing protein n=1 Tax=Protea cynaroides TaxID=273540 RepID=A0A9Q0KB39_9MAGN|nr:hypothetical protein NE237_018975 [Protea cynaroides]